MNGPLFRKTVAVAAVATATLAGLLAQPAPADTVGTPDPVVTATVVGTSQVNVAPTGTLTGLFEGSKVHLHVTTGGSGSIFEVKARLCKPTVAINSASKFSPTQTGNCAAVPFVANADTEYVDTPTDAPFTTADFTFVVGAGSQSFHSTASGDTTMTCGFNHPCTLWLDISVDATTNATSNVWKHYEVNYRNRAVADFDGNSVTDRSVFRPSTSTWYVEGQPGVAFGLPGDVPVPCDYDGNGTADMAVFRPSTGAWYVLDNSPVFFGLSGDIPVPGDYNGDGQCDIAVFRPSSGAWFVNGQPTVFLGINGDLPVPGDYDGNGTTDMAVFRPSVGGWYFSATPTVFWGLPGDVPIPGDYDGNGVTDIAVYRPNVGGWYRNGAATTFFGAPGDVPVPGDYDGYGTPVFPLNPPSTIIDSPLTTDIALFRPSDGSWFVNGGSSTVFGTSGDVLLPLSPGSRLALS